ncbi:MAG: hypothetical protein IRZ16_03100 [Myxococcaceae bacterium]|nr:hypothetical protein [Myxococcaceae bacterium]
MARRDDDDNSTGFTGKRKKTWRELDAQRGKSKYHSRHDDREQQRLEQSASYQKYKAAADALFTGNGDLPEGIAKVFDPTGERKQQRDARREAMMKLREMDRKSWVQGVIDFLEKYPDLPEDAYFLDSLLDHPRERIADKALAKLEAMEGEGKLKGKLPSSLTERLKSIELTSMDADLQGRARALRERLRA